MAFTCRNLQWNSPEKQICMEEFPGIWVVNDHSLSSPEAKAVRYRIQRWDFHFHKIWNTHQSTEELQAACLEQQETNLNLITTDSSDKQPPALARLQHHPNFSPEWKKAGSKMPGEHTRTKCPTGDAAGASPTLEVAEPPQNPPGESPPSLNKCLQKEKFHRE